MIGILCFLNSLCYNFQGQQVPTPAAGIVRSVGYNYTYTLSGAATITLNAEVENYDQPYLLSYKTFDRGFTYFDRHVTFNLSLLNTEVMLEAKNGDNVVAFSEFLIP